MIKKFWSAIARPRRKNQQPTHTLTVVMTTQCLDQIVEQLAQDIQSQHEGVIYFIGLTTGTNTVALSGVRPQAISTPGSFDVPASEMRKIVRVATDSGLQVVGQLHTHPRRAYHSDGDLEGMKNRYPGYFSIVASKYGASLPSFQQAHTLMWTNSGFQEVKVPIKLFSRAES